MGGASRLTANGAHFTTTVKHFSLLGCSDGKNGCPIGMKRYHGLDGDFTNICEPTKSPCKPI